MKKCAFILVLYLIFAVTCATASVRYSNKIDSINGIHKIEFKMYTSLTSEYEIWSETYDELELIDGEFSVELGSINPLISIDSESDYFIEILIDGVAMDRGIIEFDSPEGTLERAAARGLEDSDDSGGEILEEMAPSLEIGDQVDDVIVPSGTDFGIGLAPGTDASSRFEVQGGAGRFWDGSASVGYSSGEGDLYVEDQLEVDNTIYASHYRDNAAGDLINAGSGIGVSEDADGSWTITNSAPGTDDQNLSLSGTTLNIEDGSGVSLASFMDNTDTQDLSISGHTISLVDGGSVTVPDNYNADNAPTATGRGEPTRNEIEAWANGVDDDNYANSVAVTGAGTKTVTIGRSGGLVSLSSTFTDLVDDADADPSNEIQTMTASTVAGGALLDLSGTGTEVELVGSGSATVTRTDANTVTISSSGGTDDQNLSLSGTTLNIEDGSGVSLASFMDNTDTQDLSISGHTISLVDGGSVTVPDNVDDADADPSNEIQTMTASTVTGGALLDLSGTGTEVELVGSGSATVTRTDANTVTISASGGTDDQNLSLSGTTLNIEDGSGVSLASFMDNTDTQDLSISGHTISLVDGGSVTVPDNYNADNAPTATGRGEPTRNEIEAWANGVDDDNYADAVSVTGTTTKTITIGRSGALSDLTATFTDMTGSGGDTDWTISGSNIYRSSGNVGIGTASPVNDIHFQARDLNLGQNNTVSYPSGTYGANIALGGSHVISGGRGSTVIGWNNSCGDDFCSIIGVRSSISSGISGGHIFGLDNVVSAQDGFAIGANVSNSIARSIQIGWNSSSGVGDLVLRDNGNIGIQTTSPSYNLEVNGTFQADNVRSGTFDLPTADGSSGQYLTYNGTWATPSGGDTDWTISGSNVYRTSGNVGIGTSAPSNQLHIYNGSSAASAKIGNSSAYYDNRLYFGDGSYVYVGERNADDRLYLRGTTMSIDVNGNLGTSGQVLTSNGTTCTWSTPSASSEWYDAGTYLRPNEAESVYPYATMAYDLGASSSSWRYVYATRYYDGNSTSYYLDPASTSYLSTVYGASAYFNVYYDRNNTTYRVDPASTSVLYTGDIRYRLYNGGSNYGGDLAVYDDLVPSSTGNYSLGSSTYRWNHLYINGNVYIDGSYGTAGQVLTSNGSSGAYWSTPSSGVSGSGTAGRNARWTGSTTLGNSAMYDNGSQISVGTSVNTDYQIYGYETESGDMAVYGRNAYSTDHWGYLGGSSYGVYGSYDGGNYGYLGGSYGAYGRYSTGNYGYLGSSSYGLYARNSNGNYGYVGGSSYCAYFYGSTGSHTAYYNAPSSSYATGYHYTDGSSSQNNIRPDINGWGGVGHTSVGAHWYVVAADYLRYDISHTSFDTYDDLALLNSIECDTVWHPSLKHHILIEDEKTLPMCITNYEDRLKDPDAEIFVDAGAMDGLLRGSIRQLDRETDKRDERLDEKINILANVNGVEFNSKTVTTKISDFGSHRIDNSELWIEFSEEFSSKVTGNVLPVVTVTSNRPGVNVYVSDKNLDGFRVITSGEITGNVFIDWIAMAKVEEEVTSDVNHLDDIFYTEPIDIARDKYPVYMPDPPMSKDDDGNVTIHPYGYELDIPEGVEIYNDTNYRMKYPPTEKPEEIEEEIQEETATE